MKKLLTVAAVSGLASMTAVAEVSTTFDFVSAYVFRGVTQVDEPSFQPGIEASGFGLPEEYGSVSAGAWGSADLAGDSPESSTFRETDWYASYGLPTFVEGLDLFLGYTEYMYASGSSDKEWNVGAGYEIAGIGLGLTWYQGVGGAIGTQTYIEAVLGYGMDFTEELSGSVDASAAWLDQGNHGSESGFHNYTLSASLGYALSEKWSAGAAITYIGQGDDKVLPDGDGADYDVDLVGMLSVACEM